MIWNVIKHLNFFGAVFMFGHRVGIFRTSNTKSVMIRFGRASEICSPRTQPTAHASLLPICDSHHKSLSFGFKPVPQLEAFQKPNFFRRTCRSAVCYKFNSRLLLASFFFVILFADVWAMQLFVSRRHVLRCAGSLCCLIRSLAEYFPS